MKVISKKKIIIIIASLLVALLFFGTFKCYQSFCSDQRKTMINMNCTINLFNLQLRVPNEEKPGSWIYLQPFQLQEDSSFDIKLFLRYMFKKTTFQEIQYKDVEPKWSLLATEKDPEFPNTKSTTECLKNFNENLLYNPKYEQYRSNLDFNKSLTMDDLLNNTQKSMALISDIYDYAAQKGISVKTLANNPCPAQYLPK